MKRSPLLLLTLLALTASVNAQTIVPQAQAITLNQQAVTDNVQVLVPQNAARTSTLLVDRDIGRKLQWVTNFKTTTDRITWTVGAAAGEAYRGWLLADVPNGLVVNVSVNDVVIGSITGRGIDKYVINGSGTTPAQVPIVGGNNRISLSLPVATSGEVRVKSVELLRTRDLAAWQARVDQFRNAAVTTRNAWGSAKYGLMVQWGHWGVPSNVGPSKDVETLAREFDVPNFIQKVVNTGSKSLIWSITWRDSKMLAPLTAQSRIITANGGNAAGMNSTRDLIGEIASAAKAAGIRFALYMHPGYEDTTWWPYQNWPENTWNQQGIGDRSTFLANWKTVVAEIGQRYGSRLDAFFFDDGVTYYPTGFEELSAVARTGNPARLVSFNSYFFPRFTEFQDVYFGETAFGGVSADSGPLGGNGVYRSGPYSGLLQQGMFNLDGNDWGLWPGLRNIIPGPLGFSNNMVYNVTNPASGGASIGAPVIYNIQMYEDGTVSEQDLYLFNILRQAAYPGSVEPAPTVQSKLNNNAAGLVYTGSWQTVSNRNLGDFGNDVARSVTAGDAVSITFTGTGVDFLGSRGSFGGAIKVFVDGADVAAATPNAFTTLTNVAQQQGSLFSVRHMAPGQHTVRIVNSGGRTLVLDAVQTYGNPVTVNDNDARIVYGPGWAYSANRIASAGDFNRDVHYTTTAGASASFNFTGTGIEIFGPMDNMQTQAQVILDEGTAQQKTATVNAVTSTSTYNGMQRFWGIANLPLGNHTVKIVKTGTGRYLQLDALRVTP